MVHAADLRQGHVGLVHHQEEVAREIVDERRRRLPGAAPGEVPRVVFDAVAVAELLDHLQVEHRALVEALRLEEAARRRQLGEALLELDLDRVDRSIERLTRRRVERPRIDREPVDPAKGGAAERVGSADLLDLVAEILDPHGDVLVGRVDLDHVAAHPERAARQVHVGALVLHLHELCEERRHPGLVPHLDVGEHVVVGVRGSQTVDARHGGDDDDVPPLEQSLRRRETELVDAYRRRRTSLRLCGSPRAGVEATRRGGVRDRGRSAPPQTPESNKGQQAEPAQRRR